MKKLLIADDELNICKLIKKLIDWDSCDIELIGFSTNGDDSFGLISSHQPDIVITDIRMPGMTGLELIKKCKDAGYPTRFIIISGYAQFDYAYTAIKYGVSDFLMKPINQIDLNEAIHRVLQELSGNGGQYAPSPADNLEMQSRTLRSSLMLSLFHRDFSRKDYSIRSINKEYGFSFREGLFLPGVLLLENARSARGHLGHIMSQLRKTFEKELAPICHDSYIMEKDQRLLFLCNFSASSHNEFKITMQYAFDVIQSAVSPYELYHIAMGVGAAASGFDSLQHSFDQAECAVESRAIIGHDRLIDGAALDISLIDGAQIIVEEPNRAMAPSLEILDMEKCMTLIGSEFKRQLPDTQKYPYCVYAYAAKFLNVLLNDISRSHSLPAPADVIKSSIVAKINECHSLDEIEACITGSAENILKQLQAASPDIKTIKIAKSYIEQHYGDRLELENVAHRVYLSPAYLGILFKRETGVNFSEYLTNVRIEKSKQMLRDVRHNINEIASLVGYKDSRYFSKLFKKHVGVNPYDYRKLFSSASREVI